MKNYKNSIIQIKYESGDLYLPCKELHCKINGKTIDCNKIIDNFNNCEKKHHMCLNLDPYRILLDKKKYVLIENEYKKIDINATKISYDRNYEKYYNKKNNTTVIITEETSCICKCLETLNKMSL